MEFIFVEDGLVRDALGCEHDAPGVYVIGVWFFGRKFSYPVVEAEEFCSEVPSAPAWFSAHVEDGGGRQFLS